VCQKVDHLPAPPQSPNARKRTPQIVSMFQRDREKAALAICACRLVIFITSRDPAWKTGPNCRGGGDSDCHPPPPRAGGRGSAPDPVCKTKRKTGRDFCRNVSVSLSLCLRIDCAARAPKPVMGGHRGLANHRVRRPPTKAPPQAAPIQSQGNVSSMQTAGPPFQEGSAFGFTRRLK
jgi:hypothetical protein